MNSSTWKTWLCVAGLALLAAAPAAAQSSDLYISEYIEGSSNNKAIEIFNGTGAAVDLAAGGYKLQFYFNGGVTVGLTINLTGTIAPCDVYVVAHGSANATILAQADQTNSSGWYNGDDAIVLLKGSTVLDVIGQVGLDPGTEWGSGLTSTADNTLRRKAGVYAGDPNGADAFDPSVEWNGYAVDTFAGLGAHDGGCSYSAPIVMSCGSALLVLPGTTGTRDVTASDADGTVTSLDLTSVTPVPAGGTISRTAFAAAPAIGGTATATITVDASVPLGSYAVLMTASNDDAEPQTDTCTFTVNVVAPVEIWQIQGSGAASPMAGQVVRTENNIVTALGFSGTAYNGFFIQTPDDRADLSAETSNGIFVYTGAAPGVQIGDQVDVTATVAEYYNMTELTDPTVTIDSSGNVLPAATLLGEVAPGVFVPSRSQPWPPNELERFEGMRVRVENGRAAAPTDQYGDLAIVAGDARAFREPGMKYPGEFGYLVLWDGNPEIFEVNPDAAGLPNVTLPGGSIIDVAEGPLAYSFSSYQIWPTTFTYTPAALPRAVRAREADELTIASQNLLRFFDDNPANGPDDGPVSTAEYQARLAKASLHIRTVLGAPDILCLQEVENVGVLTDLAARIAADDPALVYSAHLLEGRDVGGIDTGFLVRDTVVVDGVTQVGYDTTLSLDGSWLNDRPPLVLEAHYTANGAPFPVTVIGVHGRSLNGIEGTSDSANRVRQKRLEQALELAAYIQGIQAADAGRRVVVTGDFNAFEFSDGYVDVLGIITGMLDPNGAIQAGHADLVTPDLFDLVRLLPGGERYSFVFEGSAQALDHTLVTSSVTAFVRDLAFARGNADAQQTFRSDPLTPLGTSDHDGLVLFLMTDRDADGIPDDLDAAPPASDFTGDLKSDILWQHTTSGDLYLWPMDGAAPAPEQYFAKVDPVWQIASLGDQTGDGQADILWRHTATGEMYFWPVEGGVPQEEQYVGQVPTTYDIVGTGDYDGDGKSDLLWRHVTSGDLYLWRMDGATLLSELYVASVDPAYLVRGSGDLDGDGKSDLLWQHQTNGDVWAWLMDGPTPDTVAYVATVWNTAYQAEAVADLTGDGKADVVWHDPTEGSVYLWEMNGAALTTETLVAKVGDTNCRVAASGDYDGDGKADLVWRNTVSGAAYVWLMVGATPVSETYIGTVPVGYQIVK